MSSAVAENLLAVLGKLARFPTCRLVAISKTKPAEAVKEAYDAGQRHFGENYVAELVEKAPLLPPDIQWHFVGHLQSNKVKLLLSVPNLWMIESVGSQKLAAAINKQCEAMGRAEALRVCVQVNTSGEEQKGGVAPGEECVALSSFITSSCPSITLAGLMTIGKVDEPGAVYFERLVKCREDVSTALGVPASSLELSMGMSADFEMAAEMGSTNVRVGSSIFGARDYSK